MSSPVHIYFGIASVGYFEGDAFLKAKALFSLEVLLLDLGDMMALELASLCFSYICLTPFIVVVFAALRGLN